MANGICMYFCTMYSVFTIQISLLSRYIHTYFLVSDTRLPNRYLILPNRFLITLTCTRIWVKSLNQSRTHQCMRIIIIVVYSIVTVTNSANRLIKHTLMYFGHHGVNQLRQASKGIYLLGQLISYLFTHVYFNSIQLFEFLDNMKISNK